MSNLESPAWRKWREVIRRQRAGGLSVAAFCRSNDIPASSFFAWRRKLAGPPPGATSAGGRPAGVTPGFVEAVFPDVRCGAGRVQIRLRGGRRLLVGRGFDRVLLAEVVALVEGLP